MIVNDPQERAAWLSAPKSASPVIRGRRGRTAAASRPLGSRSFHRDIRIKGVTKPISVEFEHTGTATDPFGNFRLGLEGSTVVNRKDWGVNWNAALEAGGVLVSEKVTLEFDISAIKQT